MPIIAVSRVILANLGQDPFTVERGMRIAQCSGPRRPAGMERGRYFA